MQVHKFASMQTYQIKKRKITKLQIEKLQDYNLHVLICKFQIYKIVISQFTTLKNSKIASTCLQICKITNLQFDKLQVHVLKFANYKITRL